MIVYVNEYVYGTVVSYLDSVSHCNIVQTLNRHLST